MGSLENQIFDGMDIYDVDGTKIGTVTRYDSAIGYLETVGTFSGPRYIPFAAIERIGPSGAWLNVTRSCVSTPPRSAWFARTSAKARRSSTPTRKSWARFKPTTARPDTCESRR